MTNAYGTPIWYELVSPDPGASRTFYDAVLGWEIDAASPPGMDYRMIATGNGNVGGVMRLTDEMAAGGATPKWLFYIAVEDVDATAAAITAAGGAVLMPAWSIPGIGRMAVVADPQGIPFYIMRGDSDEASTAFDRTDMGKCHWNELVTSDQPSANAFYATLFGWSYPNKMVLPDGRGDYVFIHAGDGEIGATMPRQSPEQPLGWQFYFRAPDIEASAAAVRDGGGTVLLGPHEVPDGDRIIVATDPHGVVFGVVAAGAPA
jgi:predicted enzyme related to lactoylglutathione lyase